MSQYSWMLYLNHHHPTLRGPPPALKTLFSFLVRLPASEQVHQHYSPDDDQVFLSLLLSSKSNREKKETLAAHLCSSLSMRLRPPGERAETEMFPRGRRERRIQKKEELLQFQPVLCSGRGCFFFLLWVKERRRKEARFTMAQTTIIR